MHLPTADQPKRECKACAHLIPTSARLCEKCKKYQNLWFYVLDSIPRVLVVGFGAWLSTTWYAQWNSHRLDQATKLRELIEYHSKIQSATEALRSPCLLEAKNSCAERYSKLAEELTVETELFKNTARELWFRPEGSSRAGPERAVVFIDDFFNPGVTPGGTATVLPVQLALTRAALRLSNPFVSADWCSFEGRSQLRELNLSLDVYRYCYGDLIKIAETVAARRDSFWKSLLDSLSRWDPADAVAPADDVCWNLDEANAKAEKIAGEVRAFTSATSAPWLYDSFCANPLAGGVVPDSVTQLIVVTSDDWPDRAGRLTILERDGVKKAWRAVGKPLKVKLGAHGMAAARVQEPHPFADPVKFADDGRVTAGVFELAQDELARWLKLTTNVSIEVRPSRDSTQHRVRILPQTSTCNDCAEFDWKASFGEWLIPDAPTALLQFPKEEYRLMVAKTSDPDPELLQGTLDSPIQGLGGGGSACQHAATANPGARDQHSQGGVVSTRTGASVSTATGTSPLSGFWTNYVPAPR